MKILTPFDLDPHIGLLKNLSKTSGALVAARVRREKTALYELVLVEIASGNCPDPKTLSRKILEIKEL